LENALLVMMIVMNICIQLNGLKDIHVYDVDVQKMLKVGHIFIEGVSVAAMMKV
jgi:hypothetical protein